LPATRAYPFPMPSCRVFLVRHGEVDRAWQGRIYGALDVPLSPAGRAESARVAERLSALVLARVVSSGLTRTEHTAALLRTPRGLPRTDDPALRELDRGEWAGLHLRELAATSPTAWQRWIAAPESVRPPGGESLADLRSRVLPRVDHWAMAHPERSIALVVHGWVIRVLVCHVLGLPLDSAGRIDIRTADVVCLRWPASTAAPSAATDPPRLEAFALESPPARFSDQFSE